LRSERPCAKLLFPADATGAQVAEIPGKAAQQEAPSHGSVAHQMLAGICDVLQNMRP
jgi:hypothetical protein